MRRAISRVAGALGRGLLLGVLGLGSLGLWSGQGQLAHAGELREGWRGVRAMAMGNAFTAVADDEQALFYNPAGLAGNRKYTFHYGILDLGLSNDMLLTALSGGGDILGSASPDSISALFGKNLFGHVTITPTLMMPNLAFAVLVDSQVALYAKNKALPKTTLGYMTTNGFQVGYGVSLLKKRGMKHDLRLGVAAKVLWRRGGYRELPLEDLLTISMSKIQELAGSFQRGFGVDLGVQHVFKVSQRLQLSTGVAFTDVGDTTFGTGTPMALRGNLSYGVAGSFEHKTTKITAAYDFRHAMEVTDWRRQNHFGLEVSVPLISLYGHLNQVSLGYGAAFDLWLARITVLNTAEQLGEFAHQDTERRWMLRAQLKFNL